VPRRRAVVTVLLVLSLAGITACGDDDSGSTTREDVPRPSAPRPDPTERRPADEYTGPYDAAKELCGIAARGKVAEIVGSRSTRPEAIARAVARDYKPRLKREAYRGCLAGLRRE
jgi:hypothetical protein